MTFLCDCDCVFALVECIAVELQTGGAMGGAVERLKPRSYLDSYYYFRCTPCACRRGCLRRDRSGNQTSRSDIIRLFHPLKIAVKEQQRDLARISDAMVLPGR